MSRLIIWNLVTLDGFFEGQKSWDLAFHKYAWGEEMEQFSIEQLRTAAALLFGRITYQGMASYWTKQTGELADFMNNLPKFVFTRTLDKTEWNNTKLVRDHAEDEVAKLKKQPGKDMFIFGSAALASTFIERGMIDEYRLCLVPVILGRGSPLFKESQKAMTMKLLETRMWKNGCIFLRYQPQSGEAR